MVGLYCHFDGHYLEVQVRGADYYSVFSNIALFGVQVGTVTVCYWMWHDHFFHFLWWALCLRWHPNDLRWAKEHRRCHKPHERHSLGPTMPIESCLLLGCSALNGLEAGLGARHCDWAHQKSICHDVNNTHPHPHHNPTSCVGESTWPSEWNSSLTDQANGGAWQWLKFTPLETRPPHSHDINRTS